MGVLCRGVCRARSVLLRIGTGADGVLPDTERRVFAARRQYRERAGRADLPVLGFLDKYDGFEHLFRADVEYNGNLGDVSVRTR